MTKKCRRCEREKGIGEFYTHPKMADGHLNICKLCVKSAVKKRYRERIEDNSFLERERERNRTRMRGRQQKKDPVKQKARNAVSNAVRDGRLSKPTRCPRCGSTENRIEAHHADYSKPLDVTWVCSICHGREHRLPF